MACSRPVGPSRTPPSRIPPHRLARLSASLTAPPRAATRPPPRRHAPQCRRSLRRHLNHCATVARPRDSALCPANVIRAVAWSYPLPSPPSFAFTSRCLTPWRRSPALPPPTLGRQPTACSPAPPPPSHGPAPPPCRRFTPLHPLLHCRAP
ncbi:hypothetical protein DENSPDRAFT_886806 [Dentipellis sp. KUC8613]|nr:hypothetical protein DENSPDRAFT_886806 [Dentipellis sp. KUC8613]